MRHTLPWRFLLLWSGQLLSGLGTGMTGFALGVHVFRTTGSATGFAMVILALFAPSIVLRPVGGLLADRMDRSSLIVFGDIGSAAAVVIILLGLFRGDWTLPQIYLGVAVNSACTALQNPAYKASVSDLVPHKEYSKASGLVQLAGSVQHLIAPLAAGIVITAAGVEAVLILDIATFFIAVAAVLAIRSTATPRESAAPGPTLSQLKAGSAVLLKDRSVFDVVLLLSVVTFFVGLLQTLFPPMMLSFTDSRSLGIVQSVSASGMLLSSLAIGVRGLPTKSRILLPAALACAGIFLALMSAFTSLVSITVFFFLFFLCLPIINGTAEVHIRTGVPNEMQGRAWGTIGLLTQLGYIAAYLSGGFLADHFFTPLLLSNGALADSLGRIIGTGPGRGIALMLCGAGIGLFVTGAVQLLRARLSPKITRRKGAYQS